jgi:hypothetical protein
LFIITQHVQPAFIIEAQQSQQAWIIAQHALSPLVQVIVQPSSVVSQRHMAIIRLQQQTIIPFIIMQHEHIPPASIAQRFCSVAADILSSHLHTMRIPPSHFSIFMVQRGTIIMFMPVGIADAPGITPVPIADAPRPRPLRSIIIALDIQVPPFGAAPPVQRGPTNDGPQPPHIIEEPRPLTMSFFQ